MSEVGRSVRPAAIEDRRESLRRRFASWEPMMLDERLNWCAERFGERPFVITDEAGTLSYADVERMASEYAAGLAALGVRPGDRVALVIANFAEFVPLKFAVARAGAIAVPMNFRYRAAELGYVLEQCGCRLLITMAAFDGLDYQAMLDEVAPGWAGRAAGGSTAARDAAADAGAPALPQLAQVVVLDAEGEARGDAVSVTDLVELGRRRRRAGADLELGARAPSDAGDMLYTSGTTGSPKGVVVTHDAVQRTGYGSALTRAFADGWRVLFSLPCYHMFGYVEGIIAAMMVGGCVVMQPRFSPAGYLEAIERHRPNDMLCVPTMTVALLECEDRHTRDLSSLQALLSGAAPAPTWLWTRVREELGAQEIVTGYGMTETGGAMTLTRPEDALELHSVTVGAPKLAGSAGLPDGHLCEYATVDPVSGEPLPAGAEGELVSRGPSTMLGFWGKPEETAAALRDGWVHSGDLGLVRADGYLQVTGRSKELYKSGGELVMPKEIEELLHADPAISQAFAIGVPDDRWGEAGCVWIVRAPGTAITAEQVIGICRAQLARFKVPKHVLFTDGASLPLTPTGKVQKFELVRRAREVLASGQASEIGWLTSRPGS